MVYKRTEAKPGVGLRVRRATLRDLERLAHQRRKMWEDMGVKDSGLLDVADRDYKRWVRAEMAKGRLIGWVVETCEGLAGGGCLWLRPSQPRPKPRGTIEPYLFSMFTEPQFRGKGVASRILDEAIRWCRRRGY